MTEQIYSENTRKIMQNRKKIETALNIKISRKQNIFFIEGKPENEHFALQVIEAINLGFSVDKTLLLKDEEFVFIRINIKDLTKRNDLDRVRGRVIGTHGRALDTLEALTDCYISLHDNTVGIIGKAIDIEKAKYALERIIQGSKHSNIYSHLEKQKALEKQFS